MKRLAALIAAVAVATPAAAHEYKAGDLAIGHPWSRPAAAGMNGAGYLTVTNAGSKPDVLLKVETPAAERVEIHQGSMAGGVMSMKELPNGMPVPAGGAATFAPGGNHLMMVRLKQALKTGDKIPATLVFQRAGRVDVEFAVQATPPAPMPAMPMH
ncbi:MAG: copper chaperone PCu(A)C [Ignavibacteriales bacterium]